jgi:hypothetical protein
MPVDARGDIPRYNGSPPPITRRRYPLLPYFPVSLSSLKKQLICLRLSSLQEPPAARRLERTPPPLSPPPPPSPREQLRRRLPEPPLRRYVLAGAPPPSVCLKSGPPSPRPQIPASQIGSAFPPPQSWVHPLARRQRSPAAPSPRARVSCQSQITRSSGPPPPLGSYGYY